MSLIEMSVTGGVLILVTAAVRAVALDRLPKETFPALWGIALLRLLLPVSVPSSFSVYSLLGQNTSVLERAGTSAMTASTIVDTAAKELPVSPWSIIWGAGMVLSAAMFLISWLRCQREFQTSLPVRSDFAAAWLREHPLRRNIQIRQLDGLPAPLTYGILRPIILMPEDTDWEDAQSLDYILFHEYVHIRRWDGLVKLAATAALCVHWFNPLVWALYILLNRDIELTCDAAVLRRFGRADRADYARMLIGMKDNRRQLDPLCSHFSKNAAEERITSVMKFHRASVFTVVLALAITGAVAVVFGTSAQTSNIQKEENQLIEMTSSPEQPEIPSDPASESDGRREPAAVSNNLAGDPEHTFCVNKDGQKYPVSMINIADVGGFYTLTNEGGEFQVVIIDLHGAEKISENGYVMISGGTK